MSGGGLPAGSVGGVGGVGLGTLKQGSLDGGPKDAEKVKFARALTGFKKGGGLPAPGGSDPAGLSVGCASGDMEVMAVLRSIIE